MRRICRRLESSPGAELANGIRADSVSCHWARHSYATSAVRHDMQPRILQQILGHSDYNTTMTIYTHVSDEDRRRALSDLYDRVHSSAARIL